MAAPLEPSVIAFLAAARVAHLATVGRAQAPLVLPVCFALHRSRLFVSLDEKPKLKPPQELQRVRNLAENPRVAVVADRWDEDWSRLAWVHLSGRARVIDPDASSRLAKSPDANLHALAVALLREKYPAYREMALDERPVIVMEIEKVRTWGPLL